MSAPPRVSAEGPCPGSRVVSFIDAYSRFSVALGSLSGISTMILMLIIVPDVIGRKFFNAPIPGASETGVLLLICKIFLGLPGAQASGSNFSVTLLQEVMTPRWRRLVKLLTTLIAAVIFGLIAKMSVLSAIRSTQRGEISFGVIAFPLWPGKIILAGGLALLTVQLVVDALRLLYGIDEATRPAEPEVGLYQPTYHSVEHGEPPEPAR
jgi:TRAP-type C4-dicarboxylate transport system permease small subunit